MKRALILITVLLFVVFTFSGCLRSYSLFYDYDELMQDLARAEIIYMESRVTFFAIHSYVDVEELEYEFRRELTCEETDRLIRALSTVEFTFSIFWAPVSVSNIWTMQGYAIKLYYESGLGLSDGREPFIILAQTGDYRYGMSRFNQARAGRVASDEDWNALMSEFSLD